MRCAECGTETAEATQCCPVCGAPVAKQRSMAAEPMADGPSAAIATRQQALLAGQETPEDAPADQQAGPGGSRRNAMVMIGVGLVVLAAVIAVIAITRSSARQLTVDQLQPGDCLTGSNLGLDNNNAWPDLVTAVPCTQPHIAEVFFVGNLWPQSSPFPGGNAVDNQAYDRCASEFFAYVGISRYLAFSYTEVVPDTADVWASGDRSVQCIAYDDTLQHPGGRTVNYSIKRHSR